jgi:simple sugar transport system substrate-binding protein
MPIPEVVMGINATALAARKVRPDASVRVVWVHTWFDPAKEADAASVLIDQGVDIMTQHTDSPAPLQVAESRGILGFGVASDMQAYAPRAQLSSILDLWGDYYISRVQAVLDGTWKSQSIWYGFKEKMLAMAPYGAAVPGPAPGGGRSLLVRSTARITPSQDRSKTTRARSWCKTACACPMTICSR